MGHPALRRLFRTEYTQYIHPHTLILHDGEIRVIFDVNLRLIFRDAI
jgi:hypothetical protein